MLYYSETYTKKVHRLILSLIATTFALFFTGLTAYAAPKPPPLIIDGAPAALKVADEKNMVPIKGIDGVKCSGNTCKLRPEALAALKEAGAIALREGYSLRITSSWRSAARQKEIASTNSNGAAVAQGVSAHNTGLAVDLILQKNGKDTNMSMSYESQKVNADTEKLNTIMAEAGWVRYCAEVWHFEYGIKFTNTTRSQACSGTKKGATGPKPSYTGTLSSGAALSGGSPSAPTTDSNGGASGGTSSGGSTSSSPSTSGGGSSTSPSTSGGTGGGTSSGGSSGGSGGTSGGEGGSISSGGGGSGGTATATGAGGTVDTTGNTNSGPPSQGVNSTLGAAGSLINNNLGGKGFSVAMQTNFKEPPKEVRDACLKDSGVTYKDGGWGYEPQNAAIGRDRSKQVSLIEYSFESGSLKRDTLNAEGNRVETPVNGEWRCTGVRVSYDVATGQTIYNPLLYQVIRGTNGLDLLTRYSNKVYIFLASIVGIIAVLMVVVGGVQIIIGQDSEGKERITAALAGIALLFLTSVILYTINPNFFRWNIEGNDTALYSAAGSVEDLKLGQGNTQAGDLIKPLPESDAAATTPPADSTTPADPAAPTTAPITSGDESCDTKGGTVLPLGLLMAYSASFEGFTPTAHDDLVAGSSQRMIGFGHNITKIPIPGVTNTITPEQARNALKNSLSKAQGEVGRVQTGTGDPARDAVLADMAFNMGAGKKGGACGTKTGSGLGGFNCLREALLAKDYKKAADEINKSKASGQNGLRGLAIRYGKHAEIMRLGGTAAIQAMEKQAKSGGQGAKTYPMICKSK